MGGLSSAGMSRWCCAVLFLRPWAASSKSGLSHSARHTRKSPRACVRSDLGFHGAEAAASGAIGLPSRSSRVHYATPAAHTS